MPLKLLGESAMDGHRFVGIDRKTLFLDIDPNELCASNIEPLEFSKSIKNKQIKNSDFILSCHPAAENAYLTWCELTENKHIDWTSTRYANFLNQRPPLYLLKNESKKASYLDHPNFLFFSLFDIVRSFLQSKNQESFTVKLLNKETDPRKIEYFAWREVLQLLYSNVLNKDVGLPNLRDLINENMPIHLKLVFFRAKSLEVEKLIESINISLRQYNYQVAKRRKFVSLSPETSMIFFPQILKDAKYVGK